MLTVATLGQFALHLNGQPVELPSRSAQSILAYLLVHSAQPVRREQLAGMFWPLSGEENARTNLRHSLWQIRKALEPTERGAYLQADYLTVKITLQQDDWFDAAILSGPTSSLEDIQRQVAVYDGEFLPGFYDEWVILERERLRSAYEQKMGQLLDQLARTNAWDQVRIHAERWLNHNPAAEPAYCLLMLALAAGRDRAAAALVYQRCTEILKSEIGLQPAEQTNQVYQGILAGDAPQKIYQKFVLPHTEFVPSRRSDGPAPGMPPYKGLQPYTEADQHLFAGRAALVEKLLNRLNLVDFLAVIGASGSGKSSLVRAGLVPAYRSAYHSAAREGSLRVSVIFPTAHPLVGFAAALHDVASSDPSCHSLAQQMISDPNALKPFPVPPNRAWLLVVDQFEELFSLYKSEEERLAFINHLLLFCSPANPGHKVVITLRADYY